MDHQADTYLSSGSNVLKVLEYESGGHFYGINMLKVSRILKELHGFRTLVNAAPSVRGAFNDHGNIVPLIDLNMFLGGEPTSMEGKCRIIVCEFFGVLNGLLVDNVEAVHTLLWEKVINAEDIFEDIKNPYVISIVQPTEDKMILLLDYETILLELTPEQSDKEKEKIKNLSIDGKGMTILIADDSPSIRDFLEQELLEKNFKVISAKDGKDAWEKVNKEKVDLIISDVEMPRMDGLALTKLVRDDQEYSDLPIIVYSSIGDMGMKQRASYLKADHITKLNMDELLEKVSALLKLKLTAN